MAEKLFELHDYSNYRSSDCTSSTVICFQPDYFGFRIFYIGMASFQKRKSLRNCTAMHDERKSSVKITFSEGNFPYADQKASLSIILKIFLILFNSEPRSSYKLYSYKSELV